MPPPHPAPQVNSATDKDFIRDWSVSAAERRTRERTPDGLNRATDALGAERVKNFSYLVSAGFYCLSLPILELLPSLPLAALLTVAG